VQVHVLTNIDHIAGGRDHSLAIRSDGTVWAWGYNQGGELGDGTKSNRNQPVQTRTITDAIDIAAGANHSLAIRSDHTLWAWGRNNYGQLGLGTSTGSYASPVRVSSLSNVAEVGAGRQHTIVVLNDGSVWTFGQNDMGQLGDGTLTTRRSPVRVSGVSGAVESGGGRGYSVVLIG
jgi:alpha-tubulin suppressor-like RCC1 family protein